ncbi:MAG: GNAT family N-acetyltransferase [Porticoccaceae bacterium]
MKNKNYHIRTMSPAEMDLLIEWAADEGWNPGLHDAACYRVADPGGFLVGMLGDEPIATLSAVRYGTDFGFLGFYIVKPHLRGKGYGIELWRAGMAYLQGCNIGLDGVPAQQANYEKSGFKLAYRNVRYQGVAGADAQQGVDIRPLSSLPFATVDVYDRPFFPTQRSAFVKSWIAQPQGSTLGIFDDGALAGYGVIRRCRQGHKIGPLLADKPAYAESLFVALSGTVTPGEQIFLDVPESNPEAVALCERHGMKVCFETARMYSGPEPALALDRLYGVTSFEIG